MFRSVTDTALCVILVFSESVMSSRSKFTERLLDVIGCCFARANKHYELSHGLIVLATRINTMQRFIPLKGSAFTSILLIRRQDGFIKFPSLIIFLGASSQDCLLSFLSNLSCLVHETQREEGKE